MGTGYYYSYGCRFPGKTYLAPTPSLFRPLLFIHFSNYVTATDTRARHVLPLLFPFRLIFDTRFKIHLQRFEMSSSLGKDKKQKHQFCR